MWPCGFTASKNVLKTNIALMHSCQCVPHTQILGDKTVFQYELDIVPFHSDDCELWEYLYIYYKIG